MRTGRKKQQGHRPELEKLEKLLRDEAEVWADLDVIIKKLEEEWGAYKPGNPHSGGQRSGVGQINTKEA